MTERQDALQAARRGDAGAFEALVAPYRGELLAHCYRMLGSMADAEDALQEALLGAWRGLAGFEGRASVRTWLYRITTNACIRVGERRPRRLLSIDRFPATTDPWQVGEFIDDPGWLEPCPGSLAATSTASANPEARYEARESVELAFVAALQHLPATQRAVLILREVLAFPAAEVADLLDTSVAAVNSALQRARETVRQRLGGRSQHATLRDLGERRQRELVGAFVGAWERADIPAILALLVEDARFTMPPLPAWFDGREAIRHFLEERMFATPWRFVPTSANGQLAFAAYQWRPGEAGEPEPADATFRLSAINVLTLRGDRIAEICGFLDRGVFPHFGFPAGYGDLRSE
ncbi:MAG TPA: sigma-70 family RNA polymerase sigma factor [Thermomicrobiales bacterium]|nr:sigma-70 family RNA polymerase sigma factor [Thermomicrobiales bacterium]